MARVAGYGGALHCPGAIVGVREWAIDYVAAALDTSGYDGGQDKTFIAGMKEWSGTFSGFKDGAPLGIGTILAAELRESGVATQKWVGNIYITNVGAASSVDGLVTYAYSFQGTGALATIPTT